MKKSYSSHAILHNVLYLKSSCYNGDRKLFGGIHFPLRIQRVYGLAACSHPCETRAQPT